MAGMMNSEIRNIGMSEREASAPKAETSRANAEQIKLGGNLARERLSRYVRRAVSKSGLSQNEIADILGVNKSTISRLLGSSRNMTIESAGRIFRALGQFVVISSEPVPVVSRKGNLERYTRTRALSYTCNQPGNRWEITFKRLDDTSESDAAELHLSPPNHALGSAINAAPLKVNLTRSEIK
jgi:transcriptional regulator with XRE-family HTH domain